MKSLLSALTLIVAMALPVAAVAHAHPKQALPAQNSSVSQAPAEVSILFTEYLSPLFNKLVVKNAAGEVVSQGKAVVDSDNQALLEVATPTLVNGRYHVYWKVTSKDGHHTQGDYHFSVDAQ